MLRRIAVFVAALSGCVTPSDDVGRSAASCESPESAITPHGPTMVSPTCANDLVLADGDVFSINDGENGAVMKVSKEGGPGTKFVSVDVGSSVVRSGEFVYWAGRDKVGRVDLLGGRKKLLVSSGGARSLAVDETRVYFTTGAAVRAVPIAGGEIVTLATATSASGIAVDSTHVYFTDEVAGTVRRVDKLGGAAPETVLGGRVRPSPVALDGDALFFADATSIVRMSKSGGAPLVLASAFDARKLAIDATHVYWAEGDTAQIRRVGKAGISPVTTLVASNEPGPPSSIAVDGTHVYWTSGCAGVRKIVKTDIAASRCEETSSVLALADNVRALATTGTWVYFGTNGAIARAWRNGGTPEPVLIGRGEIRRIVADRDGVYWSEKKDETFTIYALQNGSYKPLTIATANEPDLLLRGGELFFTDANGSVQRVSKFGTLTVELARTDGSPRKLARDGDELYWSENLPSGGVRVRRVSRLGGPMTTIATTVGGRAGPIAVEGGRVYFSAWASPVGSVLSAPKAGGEPTVVASGFFGARELRGMGNGAVWMTAEGSTDLYRLDAAGAAPLVEVAGGSHGLDTDSFCAYFAVRHEDGSGAIRKVSRTTPGVVAEGQELIYEAKLEPLNSNDFTKIAPVRGTARFSIKGDMFKVTLDATGLVPGVTHPQHLHGTRLCSTSDADTNHDGFIDVVESLRVSNGVVVTLDDNLAFLPMEQAFPYPSPTGVLAFSSTASLSELETVVGESLRLETRSVMVHGVAKDYVFPETVSGVEGVAPWRNIPVACGLVTRVQ